LEKNLLSDGIICNVLNNNKAESHQNNNEICLSGSKAIFRIARTEELSFGSTSKTVVL
jgi:hypothetical protein